MSYHRNPQAALGDVAGTITNVTSAIGVAADLAKDPYLPETVCRISQLRAINAGSKPGACARTADGLPGGVGLRRTIKPLRAYVYAQQNKWVYVAGAAAILGIPFLLGYSAGKGNR